MDTVVIGPGLSAAPEIQRLVNGFVADCPVPVVIDADALNVLDIEVLKKRKAPAILTPHPGEFSRLCGLSTESVQKDRCRKAIELSKNTGAVVVLKGAGTVIACPDGKYYINTSGHNCLAVAGSGDVLAGMIGSFAGMRVTPEMAACLAYSFMADAGKCLPEKATARRVTGRVKFRPSYLM
ncbi:NAD(P)H-hydrate dehydratase [Thermoclostridium stercorarium]|uniref:NAD(P)H-hydrate dehydratase n=1 Tax=Thermoclostridium stercorarium TaxID=1510 RepID=UPI000B21366D|nr:NAD(P)H-hydrate dehydratase [Thermoclostridium stercorarium]